MCYPLIIREERTHCFNGEKKFTGKQRKDLGIGMEIQAWWERVSSMFEAAFITGDRWKLYIGGLGVTI